MYCIQIYSKCLRPIKIIVYRMMSVSLTRTNKKKTATSKRKIQPSIEVVHNVLIKDRLLSLNQLYRECWIQKKSQQPVEKAVIMQNQWIFNEYLVANCDKVFFDGDSMADIISSIYLQNSSKIMPYWKFKQLKGLLPRLKVFSQQFITQQRKQLANQRIRRHKEINKKTNQASHSEYYPLKVGETAWVLHPVCRHIHLGQIYSQYLPEIYFVKFKDPKLGTFRVQQTRISSLFNSCNSQTQTIQKYAFSIANLNRPSIHIKDKLKEVDMQAFCRLADLLQFKYECIKRLAEYNDKFEKEGTPSQHMQAELEEYGWIGSMIGLINISIRYLMNFYNVSNLAKEKNKFDKLSYLRVNQSYLSSVTSLSEAEQERQNLMMNPMKQEDEGKVSAKEAQIIIQKQVNDIWIKHKRESGSKLQETIEILASIFKLSTLEDKLKLEIEQKHLVKKLSHLLGEQDTLFSQLIGVVQNLKSKQHFP